MKPQESLSNQQEQETTNVEEKCSSDTPTIPVEEEMIEQRDNNDSGISFNCSTINSSCMSTSIARQLSLSVDHDSSFTCSERIHQTEIQQENTEDQQRDQSTNAASSSSTATSTAKLNKEEDILEPPKKCLTCSFVTNRRSIYIDHIFLHFSNNNSNMEVASESAQVAESEPLNDDTWENAEEVDDINLPGPSKRTEVTTRKRKREDIKSKRCKQCDFVAASKLQYWNHLHTHLNDNAYICSTCPFVTKYKHHMTYHWFSMHDDLKLFECSKCTYSCVNKSMLLSHMKTHSNIYPYNCESCSYKTKFISSIKKHLQNTTHKMGKILDKNGQPIPGVTLETFSKRRRPKSTLLSKKNRNRNRSTSPSASSSQTLAAPGVTTGNIATETNQDNMTRSLPVSTSSYDSTTRFQYNEAGTAENVEYGNLLEWNYIVESFMIEMSTINMMRQMQHNSITGNNCTVTTNSSGISNVIEQPLDLRMPNNTLREQQQQQLQKSTHSSSDTDSDTPNKRRKIE